MPEGGLHPGAQVSDDDSDSEYVALIRVLCASVTHDTAFLSGTWPKKLPRCGVLCALTTLHSRQTHST